MTDTPTPATPPEGDEFLSTPAGASQEVVRTAGSLDARIRYARELATADDLLPKGFRGNPGKVLLAVETGSMLGIHPVAALQGVHVIDGKPTISPALMSAVVRRAGHRVRVRVEGSYEAGDLAAIAEVVRSDDPEFPFRARWDLERAKRAGLLGKGNWKNYPEAMLKARALGEVCREAAEDALMGVHYTAEELGADVDEEGRVVEVSLVPEDRPAELTPEQAAAAAFRAAAKCEDLAALERFIRDDLWAKVQGYSWAPQFGSMAAFAQGVQVDTRSGRKSLMEAVAIVEQHLRAKGDGGDTPGAGQDGRQGPPRGGGAPEGARDPQEARRGGEVDPWADGGAMGTPPRREGEEEVVDAVLEEDPPERAPSHREAVGTAAAILDAEVVDETSAQGLQEARAAAARARAAFAAERADDPAEDQGHRPQERGAPPAEGRDLSEGRTGLDAWEAAKQNLRKLADEEAAKG